MTLVEYGLLLLLFSSGFFFTTAFSGRRRMLRSAAASFPMGCCLWAITTYAVAEAPGIPKDAYGLNLPATLALMGFSITLLLFRSVKGRELSLRHVRYFGGGFFLLALLYWLFFQVNISVITGDSLKHIHPHVGFDEAMKSGRAFNQTLAALAGLSGQNRYFFPFHPLFAVSLLVIMGECIFRELSFASVGFAPALLAAVSGPFFLASCHITAIQAFYVNNHMLVAVIILLTISVLLSSNEGSPGDRIPLRLAMLGAVGASFLSLLRLEGQLIGILLLGIMLGNGEVKQAVRFRAWVLFASITLPFMLFQIAVSWDRGKVDAENFAVMVVFTLLLSLFFGLKKPYWIIRIQNHTAALALVLMGLIATAVASLHWERMIPRLSTVCQNALDESFWGFSYPLLFIASAVLIVLRRVYRKSEPSGLRRRVDAIVYFYLAALFLITFLLHFHGSRLGWSDSQNRMLFHFFPAIIAWVSIQAGLGFSARVGTGDQGHHEGIQPKMLREGDLGCPNRNSFE